MMGSPQPTADDRLRLWRDQETTSMRSGDVTRLTHGARVHLQSSFPGPCNRTRKETSRHFDPPPLSPEDSDALWGRYVEQLLCLSHRTDIDLRDFHGLQKDIDALMSNSKLRVRFLRTLNRMGYLSPVPELHWLVNRDIEKCSQKVRFDFEKYFQLLGDDDCPRTILEFGVGNGAFKGDRRSFQDSNLVDIGFSDRLYYPVDEFLERAINWWMLERNGVDLTGSAKKEKRAALCRFLYKVLWIEAGKTMEERPPRDERVFCALRDDPNALVDVLKEKRGLIRMKTGVPDDIGTFDPLNRHGAVFAHHDAPLSDPEIVDALNILATTPHLKDFLLIGPRARDAYEILPVDPRCMMVGDFSRDVQSLKKEQVGLAVAIRSTVFIDDPAYLPFLEAVAEILSRQGLYIDDSVRFNFGEDYRIADMVTLERRVASMTPPIHLRIIIGKGSEPGEDATGVPVALLMTRSLQQMDIAQQCLTDGAWLATPSDIDTPEWRARFKAWQRKA